MRRGNLFLLLGLIAPPCFAQNINTLANFPDQNFRRAVEEFMGIPPGGEFTAAQAAAKAGVLHCASGNIQSLTGLECFTGITGLNCSLNWIENLDVSGNPALATLTCSYNALRSLDIRNNSALRCLDVPNTRRMQDHQIVPPHDCANELTNLDLSGNPALVELHCGGNRLTELGLSGNPALATLTCVDNRLTTLDLSKNPALESVDVSNSDFFLLGFYDPEYKGNQISTLDVSKNPKLARLHCRSTGLVHVDVTKNPALRTLSCWDTWLTNLDVSQNPGLRRLFCSHNKLRNLDLSHNPRLELLICSSNQLATLDVSKQSGLKSLVCSSNSLHSLNLSNNPELYEIRCDGNDLMSLELPESRTLRELDCSRNLLTSVPDVSGAEYLWRFDIRWNNLDEGDCEDIRAVHARVGAARFSEYEDFLASGFAYSPQNEDIPLDCGLEEPTPTLTPVHTPTPAPPATPTALPGPSVEQFPVAAGPEAVGIVPLTGDVSLWAENGGGSKYWRPEADTLSNGNAIVLYVTHRGRDRVGYLTTIRVSEEGLSVVKTVRFTDHPMSTFEHNADLGVDSSGNVIVAWQDQSWERFQPGRWEVLARMFNRDLEPLTPSFCLFEVGNNTDVDAVDPILGPGRTKQAKVAMNDNIIVAIAQTNEVPYGDSASGRAGGPDEWYTYTYIARVLRNPTGSPVKDWEIH